MAEGITSAVALPDTDPRPTSPENGRKRRQSIRDNRDPEDGKRRRLSTESQDHPAAPGSKPRSIATVASTADTDARLNRRKTGPENDRKRSQRLFGSLLGTLSQTTVTAAQQRRADIERKQQAKLKSQHAEYDEGRRKRLDELAAGRRKEQWIYARSAMEIRHSNMLAMAHSLKTKTEPVLYYKPWQLRPEEESRIEAQIEDTKSKMAKEVEEFDRNAKTALSAEPAPEPPTEPTDTKSEAEPSTEEPETDITTTAEMETVGARTNEDDQGHQPLSHPHPDTTDATNDPNNDNTTRSSPKPLVDHSEEVMLEDKEDTVIY